MSTTKETGWISTHDYFEVLLDHINGDPTDTAPRKFDYTTAEPLPRFWTLNDGGTEGKVAFWPQTPGDIPGACTKTPIGCDPDSGGASPVACKGKWWKFSDLFHVEDKGSGTLAYFYVPFNWEFRLCSDDVTPSEGPSGCPPQFTYEIQEGPWEGLRNPNDSATFTAALKTTRIQDWKTYNYVWLRRKRTFEHFVLDLCTTGNTQIVGDKLIGGVFEGRGQNGENVLQVGSEACDTIVTNYCKGQPCAQSHYPICQCFCEEGKLHEMYPDAVEIWSSVLCFGPECRTKGYVTQKMKDGECSPPFCYDVIRDHAKDIKDRHHTHIWCNDQWVPVPPPTPTEPHPSATPGDGKHHPSDSPTWIYWVVGSGVVALGILITLLIIFIRRKK